jgi:serine protease Do
MKMALAPFAATFALFLTNAPQSQAQVKRETPIVLAVRKALPSVVAIRVERSNSWGRKEGSGTGIIVDERGFVVTNYHVVGGGSRIAVQLADRTEVPVSVLVEDQRNDMAILKLPAGKYRPLGFASGTDLMVGETVIAIGHPYGYCNTVSTGIISALGREITMPAGDRLTNLIQTNASINPGNSGGPLININGELIGMNVALREGAQGIAFALNADTVQKVLARHLSARKLANINHGLSCREETVEPEGENRQHVIVEKVDEESAAAAAGVRKGDVLIKLAGRTVSNRFDVERAFWSYKAGEKIEARVLRQGRETLVALTLGDGSNQAVASQGEAPAKGKFPDVQAATHH